MKKNIEFVYAYRDASNYKSVGCVVFRPSENLSLQEGRARLQAALGTDGTFMADQVRVPEVFLYLEGAADPDGHCLHQFLSIAETPERENDRCGRSLAEFVTEVERASREGWLGFDPHNKAGPRKRFRFSI
jgi:hypothetical protein